MSLDQEAITQQLALLVTHRRTLAHLLQQAAQFGGEVFAPPQTANGIAVARANIILAKTALRENGAAVEDEPNDDAPSAIPPDAIEAARSIAEQRALDAILEKYIDEMDKLLIDRKLRQSKPDDEVRDIARIRTLTALRRLDGDRNKILTWFLHDAGLLGGQRKPIIEMSRANLSGVNLKGAILRDADLSFADLKGANLQEANLIMASLWAAALREADLRGADLNYANLSFADLRGANLRGANLHGANLDAAKLQGAIMPDGSKQEVTDEDISDEDTSE